MASVLSLLLPALIPSWRFFKSVEPSPRVQWRLVPPGADDWVEYRPRPKSVSVYKMLRRLVWNPRWNECLFMVSLAERLMHSPTQHSVDESSRRLVEELFATQHNIGANQKLQFRLVFICRDGKDLVQSDLYISDPIEFSRTSR